MNEEMEKELKKLLENVTADTTKNIFECVRKICLNSENKIDDMFIPLLNIAEEKLLKLIDKIDGVEK